MRELWEQKHPQPGASEGSKIFTSNMLIGGHEIGVAPDPEKIKILISEKKKDLERIKSNFVKR